MLPSRAPAPRWPSVAFFQILQAPGEPLGQPLHLVVDGGPGAAVPLVLNYQRLDHGLGEPGVASTARSMAAWASFDGLPGPGLASIRIRQRMRMSRFSSYSGSPRMVLSRSPSGAGQPLGQPLHLVVDGGPGAAVPLVLNYQRLDHGLGEPGVASTARSMAAWASFDGLPGPGLASIRIRQRMRMSRFSSYSGSPRMVLSRSFTAAAGDPAPVVGGSASRPSS